MGGQVSSKRVVVKRSQLRAIGNINEKGTHSYISWESEGFFSYACDIFIRLRGIEISLLTLEHLCDVNIDLQCTKQFWGLAFGALISALVRIVLNV